jgi:mxaK protein
MSVLGLAGVVWSSWEVWSRSKQNAALSAVVAGDDIAVSASSAPGLVLARARFLDRRDRFEEAQTFIDEALPGLPPHVQAGVLYNHANVYVERAIARIERGDLDGAIPLINLAKDGYRRALRLDPNNYDLKYNFDVAMRLVRDFPPGGPDGEDETATPKKLWTDLPGVPKGLP